MLLNLSNHPSDGWTQEQTVAAEKEFGQIRDERFPLIPPEFSGEEVKKLAEEYLQKCKAVLGSPGETDAVMLSGEIVFCSMLSGLLLEAGFRVVCATTERNVVELGDGRVERTFRFIRFRDYVMYSSHDNENKE